MSSKDDTPPSPTLVKHTTTNVTPKQPFLDTSAAPINAAPVELDSTPVSPVARKESWKVKAAGRSSVVSPDVEEEEAYGELTGGEKGGNEVSREKRKQLLAERSRDPAVLVDLPQTPRAEEYEIANVTNAPGGKATGSAVESRKS